MFDYLTELMLKSYFTAEVTLGRFLNDKERKRLFFVYSEIFLVPEKEADELYSHVCSEELLSISSEREYFQRLRLKQYLSINKRKGNLSPVFEELIDLKGNAFTEVLKDKLLNDAGETQPAACKNLTDASKDGNVAALIVLGIFQTEGILFCKDERGGLGKLRKAADWNSEEGLLASLRYREEERGKLLPRLKDCFIRAGHPDAFQKVAEKYGPAKESGGEWRLLEKAFAQGIVKRFQYNKSYARLIYSNILSERDKEALLLSPDRATFYDACALPLKLGTGREEIHPQAPAFRSGHPEEMEKLLSSLRNADLRRLASYRPLLLVSDSRYLPTLYAEAIAKSFPEAHVETIEVGELDELDFEPTKNNIFVRSCDEDAMNVYLLSFRGEIGGRIFDLAKGFLRSDLRRKFRLNRPGVTIDLSGILPVCLCDRINAERLKPYCDELKISPPSEEEKKGIVSRILAEKQALYGVENFVIRENCSELLLSLAVDEIEQTLNIAVGENRFKEPTLTRELLESYLTRIGTGRNRIGFGGDACEKRE